MKIKNFIRSYVERVTHRTVNIFERIFVAGCMEIGLENDGNLVKS